ncbi:MULTISPECIES: hypothetical protein [unclassified Modestobacter]|uniref:hypothetical protein n=1 Tax=unclassified Modestobacter TaxID=2643866 RepID=UPI0022AA76C8|nr:MULTISPECIES: hypothetical protein [unclassified Modestobacter]MCZ2811364.1 hypothetical protein [Modestobacter sp. VKM Ac-2979]MCZ2840877.1 hypothetical protein [Modestobacter sp. VKM Ac-2980]MCZ2848162.1 hypothetical protein [Modestobacter sp. VKM Ac-2978]
MRALTTPFRAGLSAAAAVVLLAGCGSDDEQPDAASTATSSSSASSSATTSDEEVQAFCTEAETVLTTPPEAGLTQQEQLDRTITDLEQLDPPAEISADWDVLIQTFVGVREAVADVDLTTPEGQASVEEELAGLEAEATDAQTRLDAWLTENCDNA